MPDSSFVNAEQFRTYIDTMQSLLKMHPHHFNVMLDNDSIVDCDFYGLLPTTDTDECNREVQSRNFDADC